MLHLPLTLALDHRLSGFRFHALLPLVKVGAIFKRTELITAAHSATACNFSSFALSCASCSAYQASVVLMVFIVLSCNASHFLSPSHVCCSQYAKSPLTARYL